MENNEQLINFYVKYRKGDYPELDEVIDGTKVYPLTLQLLHWKEKQEAALCIVYAARMSIKNCKTKDEKNVMKDLIRKFRWYLAIYDKQFNSVFKKIGIQLNEQITPEVLALIN